MNESELKLLCNYKVHPIVSIITTNEGFVKIDIVDNGSIGGTHWTCFVVKDNNFYFCDSFGGQPDKFLLNQLNKPIIYHNYKIQDMTSNFCGYYCLYFFYLVE